MGGSCIAIHNMIEIEKRFDENFLEGYEFHTTLKFISVKIMVSIVFIQEISLPVVFRLSEPRAALLDSALRVIEFFLIAIFNYRAWPVHQPWYKQKLHDANEPLLQAAQRTTSNFAAVKTRVFEHQKSSV